MTAPSRQVPNTSPSAISFGTGASTIAEMWIRHEDDWSGVSDPTARKKIQNRRNQRILRSRKRKGKDCPTAPLSMNTQLVTSLSAPTHQTPTEFDVRMFADAIMSVRILNIDSERNRKVMQDFEAFAYGFYASRAPAIALRPSLSQYNFIRALWANVEVLGISSDQMSDDDAPSPFNTISDHPSQLDAALSLTSRLPAGLRPTDLQCATLHHPWIDLIPIPEMRDNLFRRGFDLFDEEKLCHDMRGQVHQHPGVLVWSDPWDPNGWEVTESFVQSWGWALVGCWELFRSTNKWRALRHERPLFRLPAGSA